MPTKKRLDGKRNISFDVTEEFYKKIKARADKKLLTPASFSRMLVAEQISA